MIFSERRSYPSLFLVVLLIAFLQNCNRNTDNPSQNKTPIGTVDVQYAEGFSINKYEDHTLINVFNAFQDQPDTLRYVLVSRDDELPEDIPDGQIIRTPIQSMIATSTTHIALTDMLDANDVIKGMVGAEYAYSPAIREGFRQGEITAFTQGEFNNEVALNMNPDLVMISAGQASQYDNYRLLVDSGIAVFVNAEWLETTPLGKAEWLKVMGALLEKEEQANRQFAKVAQRYEQLKSKAEGAEGNPLVINNMPYKGAWFVSGGESFTAQFLKDAGADYPWYNNPSTGGLRLNFETVYEAGLRAEVWLNPGTAVTKEDILAKDGRFSDFKSFETGRIYNNNKRMSPAGGNDFWETGVVRPDLILSDLITILHPEVMESDSLYFYQKVE
ncbi:MAG: ABC transporter substrate-binding protein [Balneolaceae bacterium]|nr:ABC transporter substrate-binding protein [Balneolaceae bacterium]